MRAKNKMSVNTGSAFIWMASVAVSIPLVTFWRKMNVWVSNESVSSPGILQIRN